jgi:GAF domain-containing protein
MKATSKTVFELDDFLSKLADSSAPTDSEHLTALAARLSQAFEVKPDEVAILGVVGNGKHLQFVIPEKLRAVGSIPLNSSTALAARTAREKRADVENAFANSRHISVFEGVQLGVGHNEMIQKIMSAPILHDGKVAGVVQISRKGRNPQNAGADFSADDLRKLKELAAKLAPVVLQTPEK